MGTYIEKVSNSDTWQLGDDNRISVDTSGNTIIGGNLDVAGTTTFTGGTTFNGGVTLGAGDDLIGSSTSDIAINTDKFTVAGATGNTVVAGILAVGVATGVLTSIYPSRSTGDYGYYLNLTDGSSSGDNTKGGMTGTTAQKSYAINIGVGRPVTSVATGDSNDSVIKGSYNNHAANDANFIIRALNMTVNNRTGGELGILEAGNLGSQNRSGGTAPTIRGLTITPENYGTCGTEFGGLDLVLKNEANTATLTYGARIRNADASAQAAIQSALLINSTATNGFNNALTIEGAVDTFADFDAVTGACCTESGTAATDWAGRIKVVTPDGNDAWINVYSTSNA